MDLPEEIRQLCMGFLRPIVQGMLNGLSELDEKSQASLFAKTGAVNCRSLLQEILDKKEEVPTDIVKGLLDGISELDEKSRETVLRNMGRSCARGIMRSEIEKGSVPKALDLEGACKYMCNAPFIESSAERRRVLWHRECDTFYMDDHVKEKFGICMCVLVIMGLREPSYDYCRWCTKAWNEEVFGYLVGKRIEAFSLETAVTDSPFCRGIVRLRP